ncbi:hypothetical protein [Roseibium polysiphoniae]|uniref:hypothetical protein n=1 Tax=Roseibium polysiphoniae TaxID=2571221 RepID=UPI001BCBE5AA|nr:hypothetical protein [Roseibium polysiphoniae]
MRPARKLSQRLERFVVAHVPLLLKTHPFRATAESIELIRNSRYFDGSWYIRRVPNIPFGLDPARHYYLFGAQEGSDPGPKFSTSSYLARYKDVARTGMNPLVHYLKYGATEGRTAETPLSNAFRKTGSRSSKLSETQQRFYEPPVTPQEILNLPFTSPAGTDGNWVRHQALVCEKDQRVIRFCGLAIGLVNSADAPAWLSENGATVRAFCRLNGREAAQSVEYISADGTRFPATLADFQESPAQPLHLPFGNSNLKSGLTDIWYTTDRDLRARMDGCVQTSVLRCFQLGPEGRMHLLVEALLEPQQMQILDIPLRDPFHAFLICRATPDGVLIGVELVPFPGLCRGGLFYSELLAGSAGRNYMDALEIYSRSLLSSHMDYSNGDCPGSIGRLSVDLRGANGSEPIFCEALLTWIRTLTSLTPQPSGLDDIPTDGPAIAYLKEALTSGHATQPRADLKNAGKIDLKLPADSIPTIQALLSRNLTLEIDVDILRSYVVADKLTLEPKWKVNMPYGSAAIACPDSPTFLPPGSPVLKPLGADTPQFGTANVNFPLSIRFYDDGFFDRPQIVYPVAPDFFRPILTLHEVAAAAEIRVIIPASDDSIEFLPALLQSLRLQNGAHTVKITLIAESENTNIASACDMVREAGFREPTVETAVTDALIASAKEFLLLLAPTIVLYDKRTLSTLIAAARNENTASVSCTIVHERVHKKKDRTFHGFGGLMVRTKGEYIGTERFSSEEIDRLFSRSTYPVLANSTSLMLVRAEILAKLTNRNQRLPVCGNDFSLGVCLSELGYVNLNTTLISVGDRNPITDALPTTVEMRHVLPAHVCVVEAIQ